MSLLSIDEKISIQWRHGRTATQIAADLGIGVSTVYARLSRMGLNKEHKLRKQRISTPETILAGPDPDEMHNRKQLWPS